MGMCFKRPMLDTKRKFGVVQKSEGNDVDPKKVRKLNESDPKDPSGTEFQDNSKSTHKNEKDEGYYHDPYYYDRLLAELAERRVPANNLHERVVAELVRIERSRIRAI